MTGCQEEFDNIRFCLKKLKTSKKKSLLIASLSGSVFRIFLKIAFVVLIMTACIKIIIM